MKYVTRYICFLSDLRDIKTIKITTMESGAD